MCALPSLNLRFTYCSFLYNNPCMNIIAHAARMGLAFAIVGVAMSLILPPLCTALGFSAPFVADVALKQTLPWSATFFGALGVLQGLVNPVLDKIIPENKAVSGEEKEQVEREQTIQQGIAMTPPISASKTRAAQESLQFENASLSTKFQDLVSHRTAAHAQEEGVSANGR
jgi:hypothetical protein